MKIKQLELASELKKRELDQELELKKMEFNPGLVSILVYICGKCCRFVRI